MKYVSGEGLYAEAHTIALCKQHDNSKEKQKSDELYTALDDLISSDPAVGAYSDADITAAINDTTLEPYVRKQAAALKKALAILAKYKK